MSRIGTGAGSGASCLLASKPWATALPLTIACWYRPDTSEQTGCLAYLGAGSDDWWALAINGGRARAEARRSASPSTYVGVNSVSSAPAGAWSHFAATFLDDDERTAVLNGVDADKGVSTVPVALRFPPTRSAALAFRDDTPSGGVRGQIAHLAIWGGETVLSPAELAELAAGASPLDIRRDDLIGYYPLIGNLAPEGSEIGTAPPLVPQNSPGGPDHPALGMVATLVAAGGAAASITTGDLAEAATTPSVKGKMVLGTMNFDDEGQAVSVSLNGGAEVEHVFAGTPNTAGGQIVIGARIVDGVPVLDNAVWIKAVAAFGALLGPSDLSLAQKEMLGAVSLKVVPAASSIDAGTSKQIDLASFVQDPLGWGWKITAVTQPTEGGAIAIVGPGAPTKVSVSVEEAAPAQMTASVTIESSFPMAFKAQVPIVVSVVGVEIPVGVDDEFDIQQDAAQVLDVLGNDSGTSLAIDAITVPPEHGTASIESGKIRYKPDTAYTGSDDFTYRVKNAGGRTDTAKVSLTVKAGGTETPTGTIDVGLNGSQDLISVLWNHAPTAADVTTHGAQSAGDKREDWLEDYIRSKWAGKGSVSMLSGHIPNTLKTTTLVTAPDGKSPSYRFRHSKYSKLGDADPKNWRGSQIGKPWKENGGYTEAVVEFDYWMEKGYNNYLDSASLNPKGIVAPGKIFWLFWGGPWRGSSIDSVSPASGGMQVADMKDFSIRASWTGSKADKGTVIKWKGYCYIKGRSITGAPSDEDQTFGFGTKVSPPILRDQWNKIKAYLKLNTVTDGQANQDGILRLWHNGSNFYNREDLIIQGTENWLIQGCGPDHFWGGDPEEVYMLSQKDQSVWMTNFKMGGR